MINQKNQRLESPVNQKLFLQRAMPAAGYAYAKSFVTYDTCNYGIL
ncbi:hypothetical protein LC605_06660 [Nostoc sp. CHAB 5836]|nr:hypothetical protein [Nostoc sp. CHAB 5836]MCC5614757.1 hypothetical protein [Nostoc sp. CHAB 5836]